MELGFLMMLSDGGIRRMQESAHVIDPYFPQSVQPCSYDVHLGGHGVTLYLNENGTVGSFFASSRKCTNVRTFLRLFDDGGVTCLEPGEFALATTMETVRIPADVAARIEGKSSLGRLGLSTHITAGFIDAGFNGQITLELKNETQQTIFLTRGMPISQLCFYKLDAPAETPYGTPGLGSHYQGQVGTTLSIERNDICGLDNFGIDAPD